MVTVPELLERIAIIEQLWAKMEDRVSVLEDATANWDCRIEDIETFQEKCEDVLDEL